MTRLAGVSVLLFGSVLVACTSGDQQMIENTPGRTCSASLSTTGSFVQSKPAPANPDGTAYQGCWPVGMWTFTVKVNQNDCSPVPTPLAQYQFAGDYTINADGDWQTTFAYVTDPTIHNIVKVSQDGSTNCEGELDLYSSDGTQVWTLKPDMLNGTITGEGEFDEYDSDQWKGSLGGP